MSMLVGGPKIGKSWLSLGLALGIAAGRRVLGTVAVGSPRAVLLLALEDGDRRLQDRSRELMADAPFPPLLSYMTRIEPGTVVATIDAWLDTLATGATEPLVILDTLGKVMPQALPCESPYQRDYRVTGRLKRLCDDRPGMALIVLHHDRKAQSVDFVDSVSGTNGIAGAGDTILVISRARTEEQGLFKVTGRDVTEREYAVTASGGCWRLIGGDLDAAALAAQTVRATANLSDKSAEILSLVAKTPAGVRAGDVATAMNLSGKEAGTYLGRLFDAGKVRRPKRGLYTPVVSVESVESGDNDPHGFNTSHTSNNAVACAVCGFPLAAAGQTIHPACGDQ